jgi:hypothetical protein
MNMNVPGNKRGQLEPFGQKYNAVVTLGKPLTNTTNTTTLRETVKRHLKITLGGLTSLLLAVVGISPARADSFFSRYNIGTSESYGILFTAAGVAKETFGRDSAVNQNVGIRASRELHLANSTNRGIKFVGAVNGSGGGRMIAVQLVPASSIKRQPPHAVIPEPSSLILTGIGLLALGALVRRRARFAKTPS